MTARRFRSASAVFAAILLFAGCQSKSSTTASESASSAASATKEANMQGTRSFMAGMARGDTTVVDSFIASNFVEHEQVPGSAPGAAGLRAMITSFHTAFPDMQMPISDMAADSDKVWVHSTMTGTMKGPLMGMKPTGKSFSIEAFDLVRIENGKAVEHWGSTDFAGMLQQLGVSMAPPGGKAGKKH